MNDWGFLEGYLLGIICTCFAMAVIALREKRKQRRPFVVNGNANLPQVTNIYLEPLTTDELEQILFEEHQAEKARRLQ